MSISTSWQKIFDDYNILKHNFDKSPFYISAEQIKRSVQNFKKTAEKEVRILCKIDRREKLPDVMKVNNLFILPVRNGQYAIVKGEGFVDVPDIKDKPIIYNSSLDFELDTSKIGDSEMQHLDFAYASSLIRTFVGDDSLVLTIRGRKYTPRFSFNVNNITLEVNSVQTEVDAGYEGYDKVVLVEAKNSKTTNTIIRQLYYPYRQWAEHTCKKVITLLFEKRGDEYLIWQYEFTDKFDYNSIKLTRTEKFIIKQNI